MCRGCGCRCRSTPAPDDPADDLAFDFLDLKWPIRKTLATKVAPAHTGAKRVDVSRARRRQKAISPCGARSSTCVAMGGGGEVSSTDTHAPNPRPYPLAPPRPGTARARIAPLNFFFIPFLSSAHYIVRTQKVSPTRIRAVVRSTSASVSSVVDQGQDSDDSISVADASKWVMRWLGQRPPPDPVHPAHATQSAVARTPHAPRRLRHVLPPLPREEPPLPSSLRPP